MSSDDGVILGGSADSSSEAAGDGDELPGSPRGVEPAHGSRGRRTRRRDDPGLGSFTAWLVADASLPPPKRMPSGAISAELPAQRCVVGISTVSWEYKAASAPARDTFINLMPATRWSQRSGEVAVGYLEYAVDNMLQLRDWAPLPEDVDVRSGAVALKLRRMCDRMELGDDLGAAGDILDQIEGQCTAVFCVSPAMLGRFLAGPLPMLASSSKLGSRVGWRGRVPNNPPLSSIKAWMAAERQRLAGEEPVPEPVHVVDHTGPLFDLPRSALHDKLLTDDGAARATRGGISKPEQDPVKLLEACHYAGFLRSVADFTRAMNAGHRFDQPGFGGEARDSRYDPGATTIRKSKAKFDVVDCLLLRRQFELDRLGDNIRHITLYSDSSPTTGEELQGQIVDVIRRDGTHSRITLPGASLTYGHFDSVNKTIGLLWACWCVAGPDLESLTYFISKVRCLTTDMGVEMHLLETRDCLQAFIAWAGGKELGACAALVRQDRRLFAYALRISGWSHCMGNLIKKILNKTACWPDRLEKIRFLVRFFENATYRKHIQKLLRGGPIDTSVLNHWSASLATWRYETIFNVFEHLL